MSGHSFPMPLLVVVIYMEALGPPKWIKINYFPQLNVYSLMYRKKGEKKDNITIVYLGNFYSSLRRLNDRPKRSNKLLDYIKK